MILKGQQVRILPQWRDQGDDDYIWIALEDEDGGRVRIQPLIPAMRFPPNQIVTTDMLEPAQQQETQA